MGKDGEVKVETIKVKVVTHEEIMRADQQSDLLMIALLACALGILLVALLEGAFINKAWGAFHPKSLTMRLGGPPEVLREPVNGFVSVIDGDTVAIVGENGKRETVRLFGIDAAEIKQAKCPEEYVQAQHAAGRLRAWLGNAKKTEIERLVIKDKYGRTIGKLFVDGEDVAEKLLLEGKVRPYDPNTQKRESWCPPATGTGG